MYSSATFWTMRSGAVHPAKPPQLDLVCGRQRVESGVEHLPSLLADVLEVSLELEYAVAVGDGTVTGDESPRPELA